MTFELLPALAAFAFVSSITPGPNNLMLMASGANFGFGRTLPHMLGVAIGFSLMVALVGLGLAQIFVAYPIAETILTVLSLLYLLHLAYKIATAAPAEQGARAGTPMTFAQAAAFQWVNPKGWSMALTAVTLYTADAGVAAVLLTAAVFGAVNLPCVSLWVIMGQQVARFLRSPRRLRAFNWGMAGLLILSLYPVLFP